MTGSLLILIAVSILVLFIGFGFLLGVLRGFRKSLYFTIVFIVVVIISFIFATMLAKSVYSGSSVWRIAKGAVPKSSEAIADGVNSLKEYVRFFIKDNFTELLDSGITAGESIVANENAMGIIDGLVVMMLKVVMLIASYLVLTVLFYLLFGMIYLLFLRPKTYIETETTTDEDGNETVEEREIKPKKRRLAGGLIGGIKGFVKAMIILIPMSFAISIIAKIEVPTNSSVSIADTRFSDSNTESSTLANIVSACKKYDNSIGKIYLGVDDFVMDRIISYDVKDASGKKVKVLVRKELAGFINIYNTLEKEIGIDNLKDYDYKNNLNSPEMKAVVKSFTENLSNSNATTTLLTAVGEEASVILEGKVAKNDADLAMLFEEVKLTDKDSKWWKEQISQLYDIYESFADMNLDFTKANTKEYNLMFKDTTSTQFEHFVDEVFNNELVEMFINGGLRYVVKKLPEDLQEVSSTTDQVVQDKEVDKELKAFSKLIDIIRDDITFVDGSVDTDSLTINTLNHIVDTEILLNSKIAAKLTNVLIKNTVSNIAFNGEDIPIDQSIFDSSDFIIHNELKSLAKVLTDGFGVNYSLGEVKTLGDTANVGQVCGMLESTGLGQSLLLNEIFGKLMPKVVNSIAPDEDLSEITWKNEFKSVSNVLRSIYGEEELVSDLANLNFDTMTYKKIDDLAKNDTVWEGKVITILLNGLALPFVEGISVDGSPITITYDKDNIKWQNELKGIVNIGLWASDTDGEITEEDYANTVGSMTDAFGDTIKVRVLKTLSEEIQDDKETELLHAFANGALKALLTGDLNDAKYECVALANIANVLDDNTSDDYEGYGNIEISTINDKVSGKLPEAQFRLLTTRLEENISISKYLQNNINDKLAPTLDKSSWDGDKWESEFGLVNNVIDTLDPDSEGYFQMSTISDSFDVIKHDTLISLETNTPESLILQDMFSEALIGQDLLTNKEEVTNWSLEMTGLISVAVTMENSDNKLELSSLSNVTSVKVATIDELELNVHKSIVLMNTMAKTLSTPMSTDSMVDSNNKSAWSSAKWQREMPRIGEVLKTLANDDDAIIIDDANMGEDSEIKRITFERIEDNIAYSEALQNMFKNAMASVEDSGNTIDVFPDPEVITGNEEFSNWWNVEITGLANVIYAEFGTDKTSVKISDFSDTSGVKVKVIRSLYDTAICHTTHQPKVKIITDDFFQQTNIGVSEYLQYMFKPQLRGVSERDDHTYFNFTTTYNWDKESPAIMELFLTTQMEYDSTTHELIDLTDDYEIKFDDVFFGLYEGGNKIHEDAAEMDDYEASIRNKRRLTKMKDSIDGITYLQFVLASEMVKIMNSSHMVEGHTPYDWDNETWCKETESLDRIAQILIKEDNPKMKNISFYDLASEDIDAICEETPKSYILQSKMTQAFIDAGINSSEITSVNTLTGEKDLMTYILEYEWNDGINEAYEAIMTTLNEKRDVLKEMKNATYDYDLVNYTCTFFNESNEPIVIIDGNTGLITTDGTNPFLTDNVDTEINAVKTYAEYAMMYKSLKENADANPTDVILPQMVNKVADRGSSFEYEG